MQPYFGLRDPLFALTLAAIEPGLKGVLIGGPGGSGKSVLARAARALWHQSTPWVEIPLNCDVERLLGGLNLSRTIAQKQKVVTPGLLAQAHNGVVFVDNINLLNPELLHLIFQALTAEKVVLEREGVSRTFPASFTLIGTFNPAEGEIAPRFADQVAFTVFTRTLSDVATRLYLARHAGREISLPADIVETVEMARQVLPEVSITDKHLRELCTVATRTGVEGNRAELFALRCARANAALHKRVPVTKGDVDLAIRLVYLPRVGESVLPGTGDSGEDFSETLTRQGDTAARETSGTPDEKTLSTETEPRQEGASQLMDARTWKEILLENSRSELLSAGEEWSELPRIPVKGNGAGRYGKHGSGINYRRGRHIRSVLGRASAGQVDLLATLKAAAFAVPFREPASSGKSLPITIRKEDIRIKQYRQRMGLLFVFAVDASGSMAINRLNTARGAALSLLEHAYIYRDKVAMMHFRKREASLVLTPGGGLSKACRALQVMSSGGKTPLAAALLKTLEIARQAPARWNVAGTVLVLLSDCRANEPLQCLFDDAERDEVVREEVRQLCKALRKALSAAVLFDARKLYVPRGRCEVLANWLGAHYIFLPDASAHQITDVVQREVQGLR